DYTKSNKINYRYQSTSYLFNGFGNALAQIGISFFAGILFLNHVISFGEFAVAGGFGSTIFSAVWEITHSITLVKSTKTLREEILTLRKKEKQTVKTAAYGVSVENLKFTYDEGETITYPNITIKPSEKVLLTGDSRTGKSTLFKALLGKIETKCGKITYFDKESQPITNASLGYLPQDPIVFPISIKDNITMFVKRTEKQLMNVVKNVELKSDLDKMPSGIDTVVNLKKNNLSGGQRQKIVLARSEIYNQPFVLMDDVTSAIDQKATEEIITALLKTDQTILMIAHNFTPELRAKFDQEIRF